MGVPCLPAPLPSGRGEGERSPDVKREHVRAFAARGWRLVSDAKRDHWARELAERGPGPAHMASVALREHMRLVRPDWPSETDRREDLDHHVALKRAIDRAARVFAPLAGR
jgi:hypothetical protein